MTVRPHSLHMHVFGSRFICVPENSSTHSALLCHNVVMSGAPQNPNMVPEQDDPSSVPIPTHNNDDANDDAHIRGIEERLQLQIDDLQNSVNRLVKELKERDEEMEQLKSERTRKVNEGITSGSGYDTKSITKPTEWLGNVEEYVVWKVLVVSYMTTLAEHVIGHVNRSFVKEAA